MWYIQSHMYVYKNKEIAIESSTSKQNLEEKKIEIFHQRRRPIQNSLPHEQRISLSETDPTV